VSVALGEITPAEPGNQRRDLAAVLVELDRVRNDVFHHQVRRLPAAQQTVVMNFTYDGGGMGKGGAVSIRANGKEVAQGRVERTVPFRFSTEETLDIGGDTGTPVDLSYDTPARFTGGLGKDVFDLK
jgi:hypothetical protein